MKYKIINKTDAEIIETDDILVVYKWVAILKERKCDFEIIINE